MDCSDDSNCHYNNICFDNKCQHKYLYPPSVLDILSYILLPIMIGIGCVGGLGGGITKVPILILILNYEQRKATFLSYCVVFGSCIANSILILAKKHPFK